MADVQRVAVIINPRAGATGRADAGGERARRARVYLESRGLDGRLHVTARPGHARDLARALLDDRPDVVVAWGGDGTINEIASVLAHTSTPLAIVPAGSGNGLAAALGIPRRPEAAMRQALDGGLRRIDAGLLNDRLFVNIAGLGFDAHVAHLFDQAPGRRGFLSYLRIALAELPRLEAPALRVELDDGRLERRLDLVALANGREYGNGARVAPAARLDDGLLDLVIADAGSLAVNLRRAVRLLSGTFDRAPGVETRHVRAVRIEADGPIRYHVDGEPGVAPHGSIEARVLPGALLVRAGVESPAVSPG